VSTPAIVRTITPYLVGWVLSLPLTGWILTQLDVPAGDARESLTRAVPIVLGAVYYVVAHWLERAIDPRFGVLLGSTSQPAYSPSAVQHAPVTTVPADAVPDVPDTVPDDAGE